MVLRVPNAELYRRLAGADEGSFAMRVLAYNNLLGFPYLHGYNESSLHRAVTGRGFEYLSGFNSELITMPFADVSTRVHNEQIAISEAVAAWSLQTSKSSGTLSGPWIELVYRRIDEVPAAAGPVRPTHMRFLKRAS